MNQGGKYRILHILVDVEEGGPDAETEMRERVGAMEREILGFYCLGSDQTHGWPTVAAYDNAKKP